jgi:hypothetical protein
MIDVTRTVRIYLLSRLLQRIMQIAKGTCGRGRVEDGRRTARLIGQECQRLFRLSTGQAFGPYIRLFAPLQSVAAFN